MYMEVVISPSKNKNTKYKAVVNNEKTIHFGDSRYQDYTMHKDPKRKITIYQDIQMKIGQHQMLHLLHFYQGLYYGKNLH